MVADAPPPRMWKLPSLDWIMFTVNSLVLLRWSGLRSHCLFLRADFSFLVVILLFCFVLFCFVRDYFLTTFLKDSWSDLKRFRVSPPLPCQCAAQIVPEWGLLPTKRDFFSFPHFSHCPTWILSCPWRRADSNAGFQRSIVGRYFMS